MNFLLALWFYFFRIAKFNFFLQIYRFREKSFFQFNFSLWIFDMRIMIEHRFILICVIILAVIFNISDIVFSILLQVSQYTMSFQDVCNDGFPQLFILLLSANLALLWSLFLFLWYLSRLPAGFLAFWFLLVKFSKRSFLIMCPKKFSWCCHQLFLFFLKYFLFVLHFVHGVNFYC